MAADTPKILAEITVRTLDESLIVTHNQSIAGVPARGGRRYDTWAQRSENRLARISPPLPPAQILLPRKWWPLR